MNWWRSNPDRSLQRLQSWGRYPQVEQYAHALSGRSAPLPLARFVSVGGAIANDVHGKNHHHAGTFGRHVRRFELLRSNGQRLLCSPSENSDWYAATVGGLGLTGLIVWAEVQLRRIHNPYMLVETLPFRGLEEFFERSLASDRSHEYTVAWVDCLARGPRLGRGLLFRGNHAPALPETRRSLPRAPSRARGLSVPCELPSFALHPLWVRAFNSLYFHHHSRRPGSRLTHYAPFFFPTWRLLAELERMTGEYGGALYPAKDSRMTPGSFAASFPQREAFPRYVDPAFSSSFWRRVGGGQQVDTP